jgi:cysteine-rich repeat protein
MRVWKIALAAALVAGVALPTLANFHLMQIVQVFGGTPAAPQAQYFMLQSYAFGQDQLAGHTYEIYDASGALTEAGVFPENVANSASQMNVLLATAQAESFFNVDADVQIPAEIMAAGGRVCFNNGIDCVAWGNYAGGGCGVGAPFNSTSGGLHPGRAAKRKLDTAGDPNQVDPGDDTNNCSTDFADALPSPRNNANILGTIPPSTCGNGVVEGVEQCDDHNTNSGDGCSNTCATEAGGPKPSLSIADVSTSEGNSGTKTLTFTVTLSAAASTAVTYNIATSNGTATAGSDYVASSLNGETIPAGQTTRSFVVTINGDTTAEANETFNVTASAVSGATVGDGAAVGTISNDDTPALSIADVATAEGNSGTKLLTFTVSLSGPTSSAVSYTIATSNGTATAGSDYVASSLSGQTIPAGQTSKSFAVTINGDTTFEPSESFNVTVSAVTGATVGDGAAVGTISNDDLPALSIADVAAAEGNGGTKLITFTVQLSAPPITAVTYNIATANGTATAGSDYVASSLSGQSIPAGQTSKSFAVTINGDAVAEQNETFNVTVSAVSGATVSDGTALGTISNDDQPEL